MAKQKEEVIIFKTQNELISNLKDELIKLAKADNRTLSGLIKKILIDYILISKS